MPAWHILNTRPQDRANELSEALRQAGYLVSELPLLAFSPCVLTSAQHQIMQDIHADDVVIVVSPIAATFGLTWMAAHPSAVWQHVRWFAVGEATARVLQHAGLRVGIPERANSEGLLVLPEIQQLTPPTRVLVWRGEGGRELIQQTLLQRGVELRAIEFYRRSLPVQAQQMWQSITASAWPDVVLISSGEAWQHWCELAKDTAYQPIMLVYGEHLQQRLRPLTRMIALPSLQPDAVVHALVNQQVNA
jgi:uroporphyrinogen-III synthase